MGGVSRAGADAYAAAPAPGAADHVVFNPPSAAPSVHHTPLKFLPRQDRRRRELLAAAAAAGATEPGRAAAAVEQPSTPLAAARGQGAGGVAGGAEGTASRTPAPAPLLPPTLRREDPNYRRKYHLTRAQVDEMRRLRLEDGHEWTRGALARRFGCSETFVGIVVRNPERGEAHRKMLEDAYRRWGRKKREAKEDRLRRRETWVRDL
ncbi:mitochondrial ribosomal protein subunit L20-domain-containing protein [Lineolata rhizophorae]|uniref:Mitochondrial ribosomal protein subunit L20-domain-containing protein n=1 Tax=Lineolata rhizophorae TaxID=578093 RepID=A0A6A6P3C3_9PEZI|nr:mitochondrial ribosomal protein subunit L20-domain-containing protein [Lineolata rhizophorae]